MTTQVNTFQDILDALEKEPALREQLRSYIHTEELLQLPAQFVLLRADVDELKKGQARLEGRMDRLEEGQAQLQEGQAGLANRMDRLEEVTTGIASRMDRLEEATTGIASRMDRIEGRFGNFEGRQYEQTATPRIVVRAPILLGIKRPQIALAHVGPVRQSFHDAMADAIEDGRISEEEYMDLGDADLIVRGGNRRHAVVEISLGPDNDDITRAVRRSEILQRATGEDVVAVVATPSPHPALVEEAERRSSHVIDIPSSQ